MLVSPTVLFGVSRLNASLAPVGRVYAFDQGKVIGAARIPLDRSIPEKALNEPESVTVTGTPEFVSLGEGGDLVIEYPARFADGRGVDIRVLESTWGNSPVLERATVFVSEDGKEWHYAGVADSTGSTATSPYTESSFDLASLGSHAWRFVKISDFTNSRYADYSDGFDLALVEALHPWIRGRAND